MYMPYCHHFVLSTLLICLNLLSGYADFIQNVFYQQTSSKTSESLCSYLHIQSTRNHSLSTDDEAQDTEHVSNHIRNKKI